MTDIPTITQEEAVEVRARLCALLLGRDGADFDGEVHLTSAEAQEVIAALSPNMDHAVGGVRRETLIRAMYEAWPHTVTSQALNELTGLPYGATIPYGMAQRCGASFVALERYADGILALSATTPPVNRDAVREAVALLANAETAYRIFCEAREAMNAARPDVMGTPAERRLYDERQIADVEAQREHHRTAILLAQGASQVLYSFRALATPPLDNTGLDAAKDVTYVLQHNPNCPSPYLVRLCGKGTIDMKPYAVTSDRFGFGKTFGEAYAAALASGDRS